jgi:hypothetical protein
VLVFASFGTTLEAAGCSSTSSKVKAVGKSENWVMQSSKASAGFGLQRFLA